MHVGHVTTKVRDNLNASYLSLRNGADETRWRSSILRPHWYGDHEVCMSSVVAVSGVQHYRQLLVLCFLKILSSPFESSNTLPGYSNMRRGE